MLDNDVSAETLNQWRQHDNHTQLAKFQRLQEDIKFLPFTPEVGLLNHIAANLQAFEQGLRQRCADNQLRIGDIVGRYDVTLQGGPLRSAAKVATRELIDYVQQRTGRSTDMAREQLCAVFVNSAWDEFRADFMQLFGPMV